MMNNNNIITNDNLRKLIILCTYNIKGITNKEKIEAYLPIDSDELSIYKEDNKIVVKDKNKKIGEIWIESNTYTNLEILKLITPKFNINLKNSNIFELMKYRNNIITFLL